VPFLQPPFARPYRITAYVDHQFPNRTWDDTIVIFNGDQASAIDGILDRTPTFRGGYWFPDTFWYIYYDGHQGTDYGTKSGVTILAAAPGEVVFADSVPSSCATPLQYVCLDHGNGYRTFYLHLEGIAVQKGEWVETGDPLGISGNSGCSLGPHLHFAVEHEAKLTDPYGWRPTDRPDPLISYSGTQATWLWAEQAPPLPIGRLTHPPRKTRTNGDLYLLFLPEKNSPPISRIEFRSFYDRQWHAIGVDENGADGWTWTWDTDSAPEGKVWVHAWAIGSDGRVGKGSPIRTDMTVDRHPPQGFIVGLMPESTVGAHLWLYAASYDPASTTQQVTFLLREDSEEEWRAIGDAKWMHTSNWVFEWDASGVPDGARIDVVARLTDGAGNETLTEPVKGITIDRGMPAGALTSPPPGMPFTTTVDLAFSPFSETLPPARVAFYAWYDGGWHVVGEDGDESDGWRVPWNPISVGDQSRIRVQARAYDASGRVNTALPQVTALTLDRTPPRAGYIRPATGGVARPDVDHRVWARDEGSGVEVVEFFVNEGKGWLKIGEDRFGRDGWSVPWAARDVPDGIVDFSARVYDRVGNVAWATDVRNVALDRAPPTGQFSFPPPGIQLSGTVTLTLDVTDAMSGLDRAIFYAHYDGRWHHLGGDTEHEDGFSLAWDTTSLGERKDATLTAWVYDRAGNQGELPHVATLVDVVQPTDDAKDTGDTNASVQATEVLSPTFSPTPSPTPSSTPTASSTPTTKSTETPTLTPTGMPAALSTPADAPASQPTATLPPSPTLTLLPTALPMPPMTRPPVSPIYWYLLGSGALVAIVSLTLSLRNYITTRRS
jgi:hypothetical protein